MTRFEMELRGVFGERWVANANRELDRVEQKLHEGKITIDDNGVAYNCIGRVLDDEEAQKVHFVTCRINLEATAEAYARECAELVARMNQRSYSSEEIGEMKANFGEGSVIVNVLTGERIVL